MAKSLKGTQTEKNILTAFAGESQARNRYDYYSSKAKSEGFVQISQMFAETALQEKEHAKRLFKYLEGGDVEIAAAFPAGIIGTTYENLMAAAAGENHEHTSMYPEYADIAEKEGFSAVAVTMRSIAVAELYHEKRFLAFAEAVKQDTVFKRETPLRWRCLNCGYVHEGPLAPAACPACAHAQSYFVPLHETWF